MKKLFLLAALAAVSAIAGNPRPAQYDDATGSLVNPSGMTLKFGALSPSDIADTPHAHSEVTTGTSGFMSSTDKLKLDGIDAGANNYTHPATHDATMIVQNSTYRMVSDTDTARWDAKLDASAFVLPLTGTTVAIGTGANADSPAVAVGVSSNGYSSGAAVGGYANAATSAVAIGTGSNSNSYGTALGYQATATTGGAAVGYQSRGGGYGAAVGQYANGYYNGAAIGRQANGYYYGIAIGREANANVTSESTVDSPKIAIGYGTNNDRTGPSTVIRGDLYLTQCNGLYFRPDRTSAYVPGFCATDTSSAPDTMTSPGKNDSVIFKGKYMWRKNEEDGKWYRLEFQAW